MSGRYRAASQVCLSRRKRQSRRTQPASPRRGRQVPGLSAAATPLPGCVIETPSQRRARQQASSTAQPVERGAPDVEHGATPEGPSTRTRSAQEKDPHVPNPPPRHAPDNSGRDLTETAATSPPPAPGTASPSAPKTGRTGGAGSPFKPAARPAHHGNRAFLTCAVRYLAEAGIRQFVDIGCGLPTTSGNVHEVAQTVDPACRVVSVDNNPGNSEALAGDLGLANGGILPPPTRDGRKDRPRAHGFAMARDCVTPPSHRGGQRRNVTELFGCPAVQASAGRVADGRG
jgi:hypothetical protein